MVMENGHIKLCDLSFLRESPIAVRCQTEEQAIAFIASVTEQFPGQNGGITTERTYWDDYYEDTCYILYDNDAGCPIKMEYSDDDWFRDQGYKIIQFEEVLFVPDIEESDQSVESLLGIEVVV